MYLGQVNEKSSIALKQVLLDAFNGYVKENKVSLADVADAAHKFHIAVINDLEHKSGNAFIKNIMINALTEHYYNEKNEMGKPEKEQVPAVQ